ncbi:hypothetical protein [Hymenobacter sp. BT491]|uniref:hypothetical protein n=1 Tax=Hymenobacter sp. BT491 TaxID=2766779 RepID=UPI001653712A|nr:hypothetical protein [Hymenobacter sp. BT491]MBC6992531.1 hypothetical protein [Hymenobacter sp. BT491]
MEDLKARTEWFDDTANLCGVDVNGSAEVLEGVLYEDFAVSVHTFFHPDNLAVLARAGILTAEITDLCTLIRDQVALLTEMPETATSRSQKWAAVISACEQVRVLKQEHTRKKRDLQQ